MDVGLKGRRALVCAASKGLGLACATALAREGVAVTITGRTLATLENAAAGILEQTGAQVSIAPGDIATPEGRAMALAACPEPDILVNNAGGPPPGDFRDWQREDWLKALDANMLTPIELIKAVVDGMIGRRFGRIVNITSSAVKSPIPTLGLSNGARSGLTGFLGGLARQVAPYNVTINNLLPGSFLTDRLRNMSVAAAQENGLTPEEEMAESTRAIPAGRFGDPAEFGDACVFLCASSSGYIVGQNLLLDGGAFRASFG
ncbi:SDR family oxidoreductase [Labrys okinawensis]|uniref:SDR family oxidoreductase n=1 Tax=Labrys okinawensis TaxID=346911 RepID=UPI0039BD243D